MMISLSTYPYKAVRILHKKPFKRNVMIFTLFRYLLDSLLETFIRFIMMIYLFIKTI